MGAGILLERAPVTGDATGVGLNQEAQYVRTSTAARQYIDGREARGEIVVDTARNIRAHLADFVDALGDPPLQYLTARSVAIWLERMERVGFATRTRKVRLSSVRTFARWCVLEGLVAKDWTLAAPRVRAGARQVKRDMTPEHFERILDKARTARERLIVWLMFGCGLRCVEVSRLNVEDYDDATRFLFVTGKAGHQRFAAVPPPVRDALLDYLAEKGHETGPLIRYRYTDDRLQKGRISGIAGRIIREAGVKVARFDGRSAHGLRAAGAADVYHVTKDLDLVKEFLGHAGYGNLHLYTQLERLDELREANDRRFDAA